MEIERKDIDELLMSYVAEKNKVFATTILRIIAKYNLLSEDEVEILCDKYKARQLLDGTVEYPILLKFDNSKTLEDQINISGKNRYYDEKFNLFGNDYLIFSEWYWEKSNFKKGNRYPFYLWAVNKIIEASKKSESITSDNIFISKKQNLAVIHPANKFTLEKFTFKFSIRYTTSLLSKPFVILAGNSGTGKTKIAKDLATWLGKKDENTGNIANKLIVPVGSDWTDNTKILGFYNPLKKTYESTKILDFILLARDNPEIPFFLILDEMNLSHVERYFSDFLSAMESHEKIILYSKDEDCDSDIPDSIDLPENLFVTGTVNIDETTYMFSPKVLDRANVIEFIPEQRDVLANFAAETQPIEIEPVNDGSAEGFLALAKTVREKKDLPPNSDICKTILEGISNILDGSGFEFAFRTAKEIRLYINAAYALAQNEGKVSEVNYVNLMDEQLLQKILPKIHGNRKQIGSLLEKLETFCIEKSLTLSLAKIQKMKGRLENYQYASFI
ncbi:MAG: hypothetical protein KBT21_11435 [Treponema sp.]|nr:hypothetical protein [Candidatus Treponema merdequi]